MAYKLAINGYGRIGQGILRALYESGMREQLKVVAINELADAETIAYLTRYDTTHGKFQGTVSLEHGKDSGSTRLVVNGDPIQLICEADPGQLPWGEIGVDLVLECTGAFSDRESAELHLASGAQRVLFSQPAEATVDKTIVFGINQQSLSVQDQIVSNASCTTNCIVPIIKCLDEAFGVEHGVITTIHSAMNDQPVIDAYHHHDLRRTRSAMNSMVPVNTGLAKGIDRLLPHLAGKFAANAVRVPVINVSTMDLSVCLSQKVVADEVNEVLQSAANQMSGVLGYTEEPLTSCDFNHDTRSAIVDGSQTLVTGESLVKVLSWFDNEWGFSNRMLDTSLYWLDLTR